MPFRPAKPRSVQLAVLATASLFAASPLARANTAVNVPNGTTDLTTLGTTSTSDLTFTNQIYNPTAFTANSALSVGTLDDLDGSQTLSISGTGAITLGGGANSVSTTATDLLYVVSGGTLNVSNNLTLSTAVGSGNFDIVGTSTLSGIISDGGSGFGFTKTGNGTLTLSGANTYSGNTVLQGGTVKLGSSSVGTASTVGSNGALTSGALGTGSVIINTNATTVDLNGQTFANRFSNQANFSTITNSSATTATISGAMDGSLTSNIISDFTVNGTGDINWTGKISRTNGTFGLTKNGNNTLTFTGTLAEVGIGTIFVNAGTVGLGVAAGGAAVADSATVAGGTLKFRPDLGVVSGGNPWAGQLNGTLTLNSGTVDLFGSSGQNSRQQQFQGTGGTLTNTSATAGVLGISARNANAYTFAGTIQDGTGTVGIDFSNQGNASSGRINIFSGTNTYTGTTTISYGTYELGSALASQNSTLIVNTASGLGTNSTYSITTTSPLAFANGIGTFTVGGLSGAGNFSLTDIGRTATGTAATAATVTLQVGSSLAANAAPAAYTGAISDGTVAGGSVTKIGSSTEIFAGANTYTGATTISAGILQIGAGGATGSLSPSSAITDNGTLAFNRTGTVTQGTDFSTAAITGTGGLTKAAGGTLVLNAANTFAGGSVISAGTVQFGSSTNVGTLTSGPLGTGAVTISNATLDLNGQTLSNAFVSGGNGAVFTNSSASVATVSSGFNAAGANGVIISDFTVNGTGDVNWSGSIRRTNFFGTVNKSGTNTLTLSGAGTGYTNFAYNVTGGTLAFNMPNGSTFNSGTITNTANVAGTETTGVTNTLAVAIGGTGGTFTQSGAGTTILSVANTYTGATNVNAGTLLVNADSSGATGAVTVANGGTLGGTGKVGGATTINGTITGATNGTVGMLTLTSASTAAFGNTGLYLADLNATTSDRLVFSGALTITGGATLTFAGTPGAASYDLANYTSEIGAFTVSNLPAGYSLVYGATELDLVATAVPEPSTWAAGLLCVGTFGFRSRRRLANLFKGRRTV